MATIPGRTIRDQVISDDCRRTFGDEAALVEAVAALRRAYDQVAGSSPVRAGCRIHLALVVEPGPGLDPGGTDAAS